MAETTRLSFLDRLRDRSSASGWVEFDERYRELLYRYARRRGASHVEAEDVVQEVQMHLYKAFDRFQYDPSKGRFRSYLRTSVIHAMTRRASRRAKQEAAVDPALFAFRADGAAHGDAEWDHEWRLHRLRSAMRAIAGEFAPTTLEAFRLHVLAGWPVETTAEALRMTRASVYQAKCRVLKRLRDWVASAQADDDL